MLRDGDVFQVGAQSGYRRRVRHATSVHNPLQAGSGCRHRGAPRATGRSLHIPDVLADPGLSR